MLKDNHTYICLKQSHTHAYASTEERRGPPSRRNLARRVPVPGPEHPVSCQKNGFTLRLRPRSRSGSREVLFIREMHLIWFREGSAAVRDGGPFGRHAAPVPHLACMSRGLSKLVLVDFFFSLFLGVLNLLRRCSSDPESSLNCRCAHFLPPWMRPQGRRFDTPDEPISSLPLKAPAACRRGADTLAVTWHFPSRSCLAQERKGSKAGEEHSVMSKHWCCMRPSFSAIFIYNTNQHQELELEFPRKVIFPKIQVFSV